ncbi:helix-turn-helix domain-containing protein [Paenirhodobacter populi]|uniref:helix-turn-helix domain-containing protein n=1 Tax=Paenirhodobacter populi TaxID=2306993 RepID=UPI0013E34381|nr:helix-turn-helix domain-containing protein [Sinirhodobacter populi]
MGLEPSDILHADPGFGLLTIEEAAAELHRDIPRAALHKARREGRLWAVKIGKRFYTTRQALLEFLQCPVIENQPGCISAPTKSNGSSATETSRFGQDLALASAERLKRHSRNTSQPGDRKSAAVLPIRGN